MPEQNKPTYSELVDEVATLRARLDELMREHLFIRRTPVSSAPTELDDGAMVIFDDGTNTSLYRKSRSGIVSTTMS